jgi:tRNA nucleotidyltransferase/poly(A) polymerase
MTDDFDKDVETTIELYEEAVGQFATRTWQMIEKYGKIEALSKLVVSPDLQKGFKVLRDKGMLRVTFEAIIVKYKDKFKQNIVEAALWRLGEADKSYNK